MSTTMNPSGIVVSPIPGLLPHHYAHLQESGLSDETIRAAGLRSETAFAKLRSILDCGERTAKLNELIRIEEELAGG